jgi:hypothetical protein
MPPHLNGSPAVLELVLAGLLLAFPAKEDHDDQQYAEYSGDQPDSVLGHGASPEFPNRQYNIVRNPTPGGVTKRTTPLTPACGFDISRGH